MDPLRIRVLGTLAIHRGDTSVPAFPTKRSESLLAYLLVHQGRLVHRDVVCGEFWADCSDSDARKALRTELWRIRSVLEPEPQDKGTVLQVEGDHVGVVGTDHLWVDLWEVERCLRMLDGRGGKLDESSVRRLERAVRLYGGDLLEGHYANWCVLHRERMRIEYLAALEQLMEYARRRGDWRSTIARARQVLRHDPLREHVHRVIMASHHAMGNRPSALRQYQVCVEVLRHEFDIEPMEETSALYQQIRNGSSVGSVREMGGRAELSRTSTRAEEPLAEVNNALEHLYALTLRLERTRSALTSGHGRGSLPPSP